MAEVKFYRGLSSSYDPAIHSDGIYFAKDLGLIKMGGVDYTYGVRSIELSPSGDMYVVTYTDDTTSNIPAASDDYASNITDKNLTVPMAVGGITAGTKVSDLEGKSYAEIIDALLFPTVNPTYTPPSASISLKNYSRLQEVGAPAPTSDNFTTSYDSGAINLNGSKQNNRAGSLIESNSFIYYGSDAGNTTLPTTVAAGNTSYKYRAAYNEGPQPKDNKGNNYGSPLSAGTVDSGAVTINGTYPWWASTETAGALTKQSLISWNATAGSMSTGEFTLQPHTASAPQTFRLPKKVSEIQMYSTVSQKFDVVKISDWSESSASMTINDVAHTYYTYTYNGANRGSVKLIVKF